jgi:hypothetical protein
VSVLERVPDKGGSDLGDDPVAKVGGLLQAVVGAVAIAVAKFVYNFFSIGLYCQSREY